MYDYQAAIKARIHEMVESSDNTGWSYANLWLYAHTVDPKIRDMSTKTQRKLLADVKPNGPLLERLSDHDLVEYLLVVTESYYSCS